MIFWHGLLVLGIAVGQGVVVKGGGGVVVDGEQMVAGDSCNHPLGCDKEKQHPMGYNHSLLWVFYDHVILLLGAL